MASPTDTIKRRDDAVAGARARVLLRQLRREVSGAVSTAQELQVPLNELAPAGFDSGRIRGVLDQLNLVRRTAHQVLKDLEGSGEEVADE